MDSFFNFIVWDNISTDLNKIFLSIFSALKISLITIKVWSFLLKFVALFVNMYNVYFLIKELKDNLISLKDFISKIFVFFVLLFTVCRFIYYHT